MTRYVEYSHDLVSGWVFKLDDVPPDLEKMLLEYLQHAEGKSMRPNLQTKLCLVHVALTTFGYLTSIEQAIELLPKKGEPCGYFHQGAVEVLNNILPLPDELADKTGTIIFVKMEEVKIWLKDNIEALVWDENIGKYILKNNEQAV